MAGVEFDVAHRRDFDLVSDHFDNSDSFGTLVLEAMGFTR